MTKLQTLTLNNGHKMPLLGLGTWRAEPGVVGEAVTTAIKNGYRAIDCASIYMNEKEVGHALKAAISDGIAKREDLFITSKLWNTHHSHVREACKQTLTDLGLDYLDLYLIHWPVAFKYSGLVLSPDNAVPYDKQKQQVEFENVTLQKTWDEMEKLVDEGLVKSIGVSNYTIPVLLDLLAYCKIKPAVNQFECHPYFVRPALRKICRDNGIIVTAYSPLGSGKVGPLQDETVASVAKKHNKTNAQILIRWSMQLGNTVIPKSSNELRILENSDVFNFELTMEEMAALTALDKNFRVCCTPDFWNGFDFVEP